MLINDKSFVAFDHINNVNLNIFKILLSKEGYIIGVEDIKGEIYGLHQVNLFIKGIPIEPDSDRDPLGSGMKHFQD